jgi:hypothetical protein
MARSPRNLDELKTSIEESMADALLQQRPQDSEPASTETVPALDVKNQTESRNAADRLVHACNTTAAEIQGTGEAVVQMATTIAAETQALAELLRKHGTAIAVRIEEFTAMSQRIADKVHAARDEVLSASGTAPSIAPHWEREEKN